MNTTTAGATATTKTATITNLTPPFTTIDVTADSRYRRYCDWCSGLRVAAAPFDVWWKTLRQIAD